MSGRNKDPEMIVAPTSIQSAKGYRVRAAKEEIVAAAVRLVEAHESDGPKREKAAAQARAAGELTRAVQAYRKAGA